MTTKPYTTTQFIEAYEATMGFRPDHIYCQITGKAMGFMFEEEFAASLSVLPDDLESAVDDMMVRQIASMRPSVMWNKMSLESITQLAKMHPVDTTAYLLSRMFAPQGMNRIPMRELLGIYISRIKMHKWLTTLTGEYHLNELLFQLLEMDSREGLTFPKIHAQLDLFMTLDDGERVKFIADLHAAMIKRLAERANDARRQQNWERNQGNAMTRGAFVDEYLTRKPKSEATVAKQKKQAEVNLFMALFDELNDTPAAPVAGVNLVQPIAPAAPAPVMRVPSAFLSRNPFAPKES